MTATGLTPNKASVSDQLFSNKGKPLRTQMAASVVFVNVSKNSLGLLAFSIGFASLSAFLAITLAGLILMPSKFFQDSPRGRRAMARSGVKSVTSLRVLCALMIPILVAVSAGSVAFAYVRTKTPVNGQIIKPGQPIPNDVLQPPKRP